MSRGDRSLVIVVALSINVAIVADEADEDGQKVPAFNVGIKSCFLVMDGGSDRQSATCGSNHKLESMDRCRAYEKEAGLSEIGGTKATTRKTLKIRRMEQSRQEVVVVVTKSKTRPQRK